MAAAAEQPQVDEGLYSRQLYVFGHDAQHRMASTDVLIVGLKGLGVEVAKNVILAGVRSVGLLDDGVAELRDLGAQFYLTTDDVARHRPRAAASHAKLASLNQYVNVRVVTGPIESVVGKYGVVVLTDATVAEQVKTNDLARKHNAKFIAGNIDGVLTSIFVDNGDQHTVSDPDGEQPLRGLIVHVSNGSPGVVTVTDDHRHGLSDGMFVTFEEVNGMTELNTLQPTQIKVLTPFTFAIGDTSKFGAFSGTKGYFNQTKKPIDFAFKPMSEALKSPQFANDLLGDSVRWHSLARAISSFRDSHNGRYPRAWEPAEMHETVKRYVAERKAVSADYTEEKDLLSTVGNVARAAGAQMAPVASFAGGVVGQEVLKSCSGKFTPIQQFFHIAFHEALPPLPEREADWAKFASHNSRYDAYVEALGADVQARVMDQQLFLVGAGAIGCEMLKNWALMGIACERGSAKQIFVTDMDTIEKSNLNRQFLFRPADVGKLKSQTAGAAAAAMNPDIRVHAQALRVAPETESAYNDAWWQLLDGVYTALDNVDTRLYVDARCVAYGKSLVDSGTLGTKGNTQVVVPFLTESYGSTRDPPEEGIPICTLKNFPHKIEHTIQWARDMFEGDFKQSAEEVNNYLSKPNYLDTFGDQTNNLATSLKTLNAYLVEKRPLTFEDCVHWARERFDVEFRDAIAQLLTNFPADAKTAEGAPFWSGTKRAPTPIEFDANDPLHLDFVVATANLHAFNYGLNGNLDGKRFSEVLRGYQSKPFVPKTIKIATTEAEAKAMADRSMTDSDLDSHMADQRSRLPQPSALAGFKLYPVDFEKDNDANFHVAFITACSNLRARNYKIKEESAHMTKFVAGKIIPAIATTTALVTGLVCIEMIKLRQGRRVEDYRNTFVNLAVNLVAASEPSPPAFTTTKVAEGRDWKWSLWDLVRVDEGNDLTMQELFNIIKKRFNADPTVLNFGSTMLFMDFGMGIKPHFKARLSQPLSKTVEAVTKKALPADVNKLTFEASLTDENGDDVDIPPIVVKFR